MHDDEVKLNDEQATADWAAGLAARIAAWRRRSDGGPLQIQLRGNLGAGKTTLVRALLRAFGHRGRVRSPTYTLCEPYELLLDGGALLRVYHFDLYRFADPQEWADAGFRDDLSADALCLIEWPDKAGALLGTPDLRLTLTSEGHGAAIGDAPVPRRLRIEALTDAGQSLL